MLILYDSREQKPYWTGGEAARIALCVGDYTTALLLNRFHIERKSPEDLYQTITRGHARFRREVLRAADAGTKLVVVVETTREHFTSLAWSWRALKQQPATLDKILTTVENRYGLEFIWCVNRAQAMRTTLARLEAEEKKARRSATSGRRFP